MAKGEGTRASPRNTRDVADRTPGGLCEFREGASPSAETLKDEAERLGSGMGQDRTQGSAPFSKHAQGFAAPTLVCPHQPGGCRAGPE